MTALKEFEEFVTEAAQNGRAVNTLFEERLFALVGTLERIVTFRHAAGVDMPLPPAETKALNAVRLIFSGEKTKANQPLPNPPCGGSIFPSMELRLP
ncbi:hypothetical protein SBA3_4220028 [Candidatus Sulfopaludibacter sp. SbA3]|nr:hypothetical protein SBA3_4220028 [Candidatus Sulfopaludibacter sp. SbA3]